MKILFARLFTLSVMMIAVSGPGTSFCQAPEGSRSINPENYIGAGIGFSDAHIKDNYFSPANFGGMIFSGNLSYEHKTYNAGHFIELNFNTGHLGTDIRPWDVVYRAGYISYAYTRAIAGWDFLGKPVKFSAGGGISTFAENSDFISVDKIILTTVNNQSWYWTHSLNLNLLAEYRPGGTEYISVRLAFPLIRLVSRPQNGYSFNSENSEVNENFLNAAVQGKIEYLWNAFVIYSKVQYSHPLNDRIFLQGTYWFGYAFSNKPEPMLSMGLYMNNITFGLLWSI